MSLPERYSRQVLFEGIGATGQEQLLASRAVIIGCGALGALQTETLARAGVGRIRVIDRDFVEASNLQRQIMFDEQDAVLHLPKAIAAREHVARINSEIEVEAVVTDVNHVNIEALIADADVVLDGTDNFETRFLINDACVKQGKPWIYGAAVGSYGLTMVVLPARTPCLRCVFESAPPPGSAPTCDTTGVILPIISIISAWQTAEALKILTGNLAQLHGGLIQIDVWQGNYTKMSLTGLRERIDCRCCCQHQFDHLNTERPSLMTTLCGRNSVQIIPAEGVKLDLAQLAERLRATGEVRLNKFLLRLKLADYELTVFPDARSIIHGTKDESIARSLYAKYIGV
ncbi:MAG: ThiF family adenylyltransferase [Acidobacteriota bacterium]